MSFIKGLHDKNNCIKLSKFEGKGLEVTSNENNKRLDASSSRMKICFLDLETTGTDHKEDKIIEIAVKCVEITKETGGDIEVIDAYNSLQDPGIPIPESATKINRITDEMVKNHSIDWKKVEKIFELSQLVIAHNASFDRGFMDQYLELSKDTIWACSINDIDWEKRDFQSVKQELLCIWHGFYYDSHRAMTDVDALIYLITHPNYIHNKPIVELIQNAKKSVCRIEATFAKYEFKNLLKKRNYYWHDPRTNNKEDKAWCKLVSHDEKDEEIQWLTVNIYNNNFQGKCIEVTIIDKYKGN